jgi:hypothetical protein
MTANYIPSMTPYIFRATALAELLDLLRVSGSALGLIGLLLDLPLLLFGQAVPTRGHVRVAKLRRDFFQTSLICFCRQSVSHAFIKKGKLTRKEQVYTGNINKTRWED